MLELIQFREKLIEIRNPDNGQRDSFRKNGQEGPGPLTIEARKNLLSELLALQERTGLAIISEEELHLIQTFWKSARRPDGGDGVANIIHVQKGLPMPNSREDNRLRTIEEEVSNEKGLSLDTLRRLVAKVEEYGESHRAQGLPDELMQILQDQLRSSKATDGEQANA